MEVLTIASKYRYQEYTDTVMEYVPKLEYIPADDSSFSPAMIEREPENICAWVSNTSDEVIALNYNYIGNDLKSSLTMVDDSITVPMPEKEPNVSPVLYRCENCGATLPEDFNCEYCGTKYHKKEE